MFCLLSKIIVLIIIIIIIVRKFKNMLINIKDLCTIEELKNVNVRHLKNYIDRTLAKWKQKLLILLLLLL